MTEGVGYFVMVPILLLYVCTNLSLNLDQVVLMLLCSGAAVIVNSTFAIAHDLWTIRPVTGYFAKRLRGDDISPEEHGRAQQRFFSLPYRHGINTVIHWITGLLLAIVPFVNLAELTAVQKFNMWILLAMMPPMGGMVYFFLTEMLVQRLLNRGIFEKIEMKEFTLSFSFLGRISASIAIILSMPIFGLIGYFSIIIEGIKPDYQFLSIKLAGIILLVIATSLVISFVLFKSIRDKIAIISDFLKKIGAGDLSAKKGIIAVVDELTRINQTIYVMKKNITDMIYDIVRISDQLDESTAAISTVTDGFTEVTQNQAATMEEVTATIEQISAGMDQIATGAQDQVKSLRTLIDRMGDLTSVIREMERKIADASAQAGEITVEARRGEESLAKMNESMENIGESSRKMTGIIGIINDISDKINLLSLNAAIEAARAGEAGRGFAVVADEISKLADNTATSVKEIDALIKATEREIASGTATVGDVVERISRITGGIGAMNETVTSIAAFMKTQIETNAIVDREVARVREKSEEIEGATQEQKTAIGDVVNSITRINELTQAISAGSEEIAANTKENADIADELKNKVHQFTIA
ncbi:MAG TPA: methyl-accepting chemotaxis protein [Spirochaetota bacterium]|nr:methyl-accepting chemotaxis protein [Spirochaetota bacterium]